MILYIIGAIGLLAVAISWIPETIRSIKTKKSGLEPRFNIVYMVGSFLLIVYAIGIWDYIFMILNVITFILATANLWYTLRNR